jgi:hypothetical protein
MTKWEKIVMPRKPWTEEVTPIDQRLQNEGELDLAVLWQSNADTEEILCETDPGETNIADFFRNLSIWWWSGRNPRFSFLLLPPNPSEPSVESSASKSYHGKNLAWVPIWCQRMTMTGKVSPRVSKGWCLFRTVQYCKWHRVNWIAPDLWMVSIPSATQRGTMTSHTHGSDWPTSL